MPVIEIGGCDKKPQYLPIGSLRVFGVNPYSESLFRVVWSESRFYIVGANHVDYDGDPVNDAIFVQRGEKDHNIVRRQVEYRWLPLYPAAKCWILEKWNSPFKFAGCTKRVWDEQYLDQRTGLLILGPYPSRGEYMESFRFPSEPTFSVVSATINRIKAGWDYSYSEHLNANKEEMEKREKDRTSKLGDIILDSQQAFKNRPSNIRPGKRKKEDIKIRYSAEDVGVNQRGFSSGSLPETSSTLRK